MDAKESSSKLLADLFLERIELVNVQEIDKKHRAELELSVKYLLETCRMASEDCSGMTMRANTAKIHIKNHLNAIDGLGRAHDEKVKDKNELMSQTHHLKQEQAKLYVSRNEANKLISTCNASIARISDIGVSVQLPVTSCELKKADSLMEVCTRMEAAADEMIFLSRKEKEQDIGVIERCKIIEKSLLLNEAKAGDVRLVCNRIRDDNIEAAAKRFRTLSWALSSINTSIASSYEKLVDGGEVYLSYASDSLSLFLEGVQMIARSENRPWTEINKLSGGQQAACGVSV